MESAKEKAIREAYGEHWDKLQDFVDDNGYIYEDDAKDIIWEKVVNGRIHSRIYHIEVDIIDRGCYDDMRPKSLQGIETNNGWTRIESEADLPTDGILKYHSAWFKDGKLTNYEIRPLHELYRQFNVFDSINVYKPIVKPQPPIY